MDNQTEMREMLDYLQAEVSRRSLPVTLYAQASKLMPTQVKIPASVDVSMDALDAATLLQDVEDSWNFRKPDPYLLANIIPVPVQTQYRVKSS